MRKFTFLLVAAIAALLSACSNEADFQIAQENKSTDVSRVDINDALKRAESMLAKIEGNKTRSHSRRVESIKYVSPDASTRGASEDSLYYLVNYENNEGFAVLGAKKELEGIYAISGEGHLEMSDTIDNPGLAIFFEMLPRSKAPGGGAIGGGPPSIKDDSIKEIEPIVTLRTIDLSTKLDPLLTLDVRLWHQRTPFNSKCIKNGVQCVVGCVPLAVAMIMSYYEWPLSYGSDNYDWSAIKNALYEDQIKSSKIPELVRTLGAGNNLDTDYGRDGSETDIDKYKRTFVNFGYKKPGDLVDYSLKDLSFFLSYYKKPVIIAGEKSSGKKHAWVIDGYYCDWFKEEGSNEEFCYYGEGYMFHMVWGWKRDEKGDLYNGYFKIGNSITPMYKFNYSGDVAYMTEEQIQKVQYHKLKFVGDFEPNK